MYNLREKSNENMGFKPTLSGTCNKKSTSYLKIVINERLQLNIRVIYFLLWEKTQTQDKCAKGILK
jgi:hypothetical protein